MPHTQDRHSPVVSLQSPVFRSSAQQQFVGQQPGLAGDGRLTAEDCALSSLLQLEPEGNMLIEETTTMTGEDPSPAPENRYSVVCAWCNGSIRLGPPERTSHGICLTCLGDKFNYPIENVALLNRAAADLLPYGFIRLDEHGIVLEYNTVESELSGLSREGVLGQNFFRSVAPCTCVRQFEGKVQEMIASGKPGRDQIEFLFKFPGRVTMVNLAMTYDPVPHEIILLIRKVQQQGATA